MTLGQKSKTNTQILYWPVDFTNSNEEPVYLCHVQYQDLFIRVHRRHWVTFSYGWEMVGLGMSHLAAS